MPNVIDDIRPFNDFYPDPEDRFRIHYAFAHQFLPKYVHRSPQPVFKAVYDLSIIEPGLRHDYPDRFVHARWNLMELTAGLIEPPDPAKPPVLRRVKELKSWLAEVSGRRALLIEMPQPERTPHAYFVGIVEVGPAARVFALEMLDPNGEPNAVQPDGPRGVLCEWTRELKHLNLGHLVRPTRTDFVAAIETPVNQFVPPIATHDPSKREITSANETSRVETPQQSNPKKPWWKLW